jgi:hypothetical protein
LLVAQDEAIAISIRVIPALSASSPSCPAASSLRWVSGGDNVESVDQPLPRH